MAIAQISNFQDLAAQCNGIANAVASGTLSKHEATTIMIELFSSLSKDAMRYQHLKGKDLENLQEGGVFAGLIPESLILGGVDLDKQIDKEMGHSLSALDCLTRIFH